MALMIERPWRHDVINLHAYLRGMDRPERATHSVALHYGRELGATGREGIAFLCGSRWNGNREWRGRTLSSRSKFGKWSAGVGHNPTDRTPTKPASCGEHPPDSIGIGCPGSITIRLRRA